MSKRFRIMAPLLVNYPAADIGGVDLRSYIRPPTPADPQQDVAPAEFINLLNIAKLFGFKAIVIDVWWGLVANKGVNGGYYWDYYDKIFQDITNAGLRIVPGFAFHQCGGNVGDGNISIPLPIGALTAGIYDLRCKSEYSNGTGENGNPTANAGALPAIKPDGCEEALSPWSSKIREVQARYYNFMVEFMRRYGTYIAKGDMKDAYVGLGPCGELRYPSYNAHDNSVIGEKRACFPTRGAFQGYSALAIEDFRAYLRHKYNDDNGQLLNAWGISNSTLDFNAVFPPRDTRSFFERKDYKNSQYGNDLYNWYSQSLLQHAEVMFNLARLARNDAGLDDLLDLHMKVPGVHWTQNGERLAEMNAGIIPSYGSFDDMDDYGYSQLLTAVKNVIKPDGVAFTCLEMDDGHNSLAKGLVYRFINGCEKHEIKVDGENALGEELLNYRSWQNMEEAMRYSAVRVMTLLRLQGLEKCLNNTAETMSAKALAVRTYLQSLHSQFNNNVDISGVACSRVFQNRATPQAVLLHNKLTPKPPKVTRYGVYIAPQAPPIRF
jgi:beta-amylase